VSRPPQPRPAAPIDRKRYLRVSWFFGRAFAHLLWHDVVLRLPLLSLLRRDPLARWRALARRFRLLAARMGGVLIKLGQYLSTRVDVFPLEVTRELAGLQDEVPPAPFEAIRRQIEDDLERPVEEVFAELEPTALGAASLAQAHAARLLDGEPAVVKVLRPGIEVLVETDLRAIGLAIRWLKVWGFVRRRVDLDRLVEEFAATTRRELDMRAEGEHAARFAADFAGDPQVLIPRIFRRASGRKTLAQERVDYLKIDDLEALERAGVDRRAVARVLYATYMRQIFVHHFVHADPHPGNLFVRPLRGAGDPPGFAVRPGEPVPPGTARRFQLVFVDFGMVAAIPERLRSALRSYLIGIGKRDAGAVVRAYAEAGILLPGADLAQLEEALERLFDRFWGMDIGRLGDVVRQEAASLWRELGQLLLDTPVQLQVDLVFTNRALELLIGLVTRLDERFNLWTETLPFARRLAEEQAEGWLGRAASQARALGDLPADAAQVLNQARRGRLSVRTALAPDARRQLVRLERAIDRAAANLLLAALLLAGAVLYDGSPILGSALMLAALAGGLWRLLRAVVG